MARPISVLLALLMFAVPVGAAESAREVESLRNLNAVRVEVSVVQGPYSMKEHFEAVLERSLRRAGVTILADTTADDIGEVELIVVYGQGNGSCMWGLSVFQDLWQVRKGRPVARVSAQTWTTETLIDASAKVEGVVGEAINRLAVDWEVTHRRTQDGR